MPSLVHLTTLQPPVLEPELQPELVLACAVIDASPRLLPKSGDVKRIVPPSGDDRGFTLNTVLCLFWRGLVRRARRPEDLDVRGTAYQVTLAASSPCVPGRAVWMRPKLADSELLTRPPPY